MGVMRTATQETKIQRLRENEVHYVTSPRCGPPLPRIGLRVSKTHSSCLKRKRGHVEKQRELLLEFLFTEQSAEGVNPNFVRKSLPLWRKHPRGSIENACI